MTSIRRPRQALALLATFAALALPGCMQNETSTTLLADGSGTASDTVTVDIERTKQLIETAKMFGGMQQGGGGAGGLPADFDVEKMLDATYGKAALEAQLKETPGVEVKSVSSELKDGKRIAKREFAFSGFDALGAAAFQTTTAELKKNDDGSWTLEMDALGAMRPLLSMGGDASGGGGMGFDPQAMMGMVAEMVGDFRVKRTFTLPGTIVETNGKQGEDGKTVSWSFSIEDLKTATGDPKNAPGKMSVKFKGDGLTLKPFKYAPSMADLAKRMQPPAAKPAAPTTPETPKAPEPAPTK
ncbi:MAG: hypothetical protein U1E39_05900 [Planctomycetota bacterium]